MDDMMPNNDVKDSHRGMAIVLKLIPIFSAIIGSSLCIILEYFNEKFNIQAKENEKVIEQLKMKIRNLEIEVHNLKCKLYSVTNMVRILTSKRELDFDICEVDTLIRTKLIGNNFSEETLKNNCQNIPKDVNSTKNVKSMRDQNKSVLQRRNLLKTQHEDVTSTNNTVKNQKVKPAVNTNTKVGVKPLITQNNNSINNNNSKIPVFKKPLKRNLEIKNKENLAPPKNEIAKGKKLTEPAGVKSDTKKAKGNTALNRNTTKDPHKKVEKDAERKKKPLDKTYLVKQTYVCDKKLI